MSIRAALSKWQCRFDENPSFINYIQDAAEYFDKHKPLSASEASDLSDFLKTGGR